MVGGGRDCGGDGLVVNQVEGGRSNARIKRCATSGSAGGRCLGDDALPLSPAPPDGDAVLEGWCSMA